MFTALLGLIGIMSAMPQEAESIHNEMKEKKIVQMGKRQFIHGTLEGTPVVLVLAGVGKVSAAASAALLISEFNVEEIIFTGVAGGGGETKVGDIVIGHTYLQHDLDLRPIFPQFYVYSLGDQVIKADNGRVAKMKAAADRFLRKGISYPALGILEPKAHVGVIVSGDQFISSQLEHEAIATRTKKVLISGFQAIEMEGAAVAQVCKELDVPFIVVRAISDKANQEASVDFPVFIDQVARDYSIGVLKEYLHQPPPKNN